MQRGEPTEYTDAPESYKPATRSGNVAPSVLRLKEQKELSFVKRGLGKTGITLRPMTDTERMTICMLVGQGLTHTEIGEKVHRSPHTISAVVQYAKKIAKAAGLNYDWREDLKEKAITAVREGLDCNADPYKRGNLGVQAMKGLGEFEKDTSVPVGVLINAIPEAQRGRYVTLEAAEPLALPEKEQNGEMPLTNEASSDAKP